MRRSAVCFFFCVMTSLFGLSHTALEGNQINWFTNYDQAVQQARSASKPMVVLFTGTDWCTWCKKLDKEVLDQPEFAGAIADKFIFVKIDFPMNKTLPADQTARNKQVQKQFSVAGYPTIVVLDDKQTLLGTVGYRPGGPKAYAEYLMKMLSDHGAYTQKVQALNSEKPLGHDLKALYEQSVAIGHTDDATKILALGIDSEQKSFFMLERYRLLAEEGKLTTMEAINLRQALLTADPNNQLLTHYQVAIIDFETMCKASGHVDAALTVASLVNYIETFGAQDTENLWRLQMIISQVFFDEDNLSQALRYAHSSYQSAPATVQHEIASAIKQMQALKKK